MSGISGILLAIESVIVLAVFLYLVHLISHIRNILRFMSTRIIIGEIKDGAAPPSEKTLKNLRIAGVITTHQETVLNMIVKNKDGVDG